MTTTLDRLCTILAKDYKIERDQLTPETALESLGIDSLGVADLLFNIEDEFRVTLPPEPVQLVTIGDVSGFIDGLVAAQHTPVDAASSLPPAGSLPVAPEAAATPQP